MMGCEGWTEFGFDLDEHEEGLVQKKWATTTK